MEILCNGNAMKHGSLGVPALATSNLLFISYQFRVLLFPKSWLHTYLYEERQLKSLILSYPCLDWDYTNVFLLFVFCTKRVFIYCS